MIQRFLTVFFGLKWNGLRVEVYPELRIETKARNFRVPDVLGMRFEDTFEHYVTHTPPIAVC
jgi:hypothetical protein